MKNKFSAAFVVWFLAAVFAPLVITAGTRTDQVNIVNGVSPFSITGRSVRLSISTAGTSAAVSTFTGIYVKGAAGQITPYINIENSTGLSVFSINSLGVMAPGITSATILGMSGTPAGTTNGDFWFDTGQQKHATYSNGLTGWIDRAIYSGYSRRCIAGVVTGQSILAPVYVGTNVLPANFFLPGKGLHCRIQGNYFTDAAPGTGELTVKFSNTTYRTTGAFTLDNSVTQGWWAMDFVVTCESTGTLGTVNGTIGWSHTISSGATYPVHNEPFTTLDPITLDTTTAKTFDILWSASDTGTSFCAVTHKLRVLN